MFLISDPSISPLPFIVFPDLFFWNDGLLTLETADCIFEFPCTSAQYESIRLCIGLGVYDLRFLGPALSDES